MNGKPQPRTQQQRRKQQGRSNRPVDIWRTPAPLPDLDPIVVPHDPAAMIRSLGEPPMNHAAAGGYFATVVERVSGIARALALSVDILPTNDPE